MKLLLDTSVWVDHLRDGALTDVIPALRGRFALWIDSVVIAELAAGCRSRTERRVVDKLLAPFEGTARVLHPGATELRKAALAISRLRESGKSLKNPGGALLDGLIAAVASRSGALLVTCNTGDFELLATQLPLRVESFGVFRARVGSAGSTPSP